MKRALVFFVLAVVIAIVLFVLLLDQASDSNTLVLDDESALATPTSTARTDIESAEPGADPGPIGDLAYPSPPSDARPARVARLADGDSFDIEWLDTGESDEVRLFGINAPETDACYGTTARDVLSAITFERELKIEPIERDEFGRVLANVWVDSLFVNVELVATGAALALSDGGAHSELIEAAMQLARESEAGLWDGDSCGSGTTTSLFIAEIEADAPGQDNFNPNGEWITIVNAGEVAASLEGWSIRDESTRHRYFFPEDFTLEADAEVRVFSGCGDDTDDELFWCDGDPVWNNRGDTGFLVDPDGKFADSLSYSG